MNLSGNENLSVRIVTADYYLHKPITQVGDQCYSAFRSLPVYRVPVIRIFGPTTEGVKTCVHIHGVFPYIFIPNWNNEVTEKDLYNFAACLDKAINTSFAYNNSKSSHVYKITQVSGKPFYGFHEGERNFLKIEFYNPAIVKRAADLLLNAAVFNRVFQPHEAHIPYILQFFIDNNLYGMSNISFSSYRVRKNYPQNDLNISETDVVTDANVPKLCYSKLEVDITVSDLCTLSSSGDDVPNNPGLAFIWEEERKHRRFNQRSSQITPSRSQERPEKPITRTEKYLREKLDRRLQAIKDNENIMDMEYDNSPSLSSTCEELNTQSRSLLEILDHLVDQRKNESKQPQAPDSGSSSPSLVYSDDENSVADISAISSQPVLKFSAEEDSILGNNFSDEENDIDDHDHKVLSQSLIYTRCEPVSSDDSDPDSLGPIPQLDGAHDIDSSSKRKSKSGTASKRNRQQKPRKQELRISKNNKQNISAIEKTYNLRSRGKTEEDPKPCENFKPIDFKIVLNRVDTKFSPRKSYPRLNIDTQKSPRCDPSKSINNICDLSSPQEKLSPSNTSSEPTTSSILPSPSTSISRASNLSNSATKGDKRQYPQLDVSIKKSPKTIKPIIDEEAQIEGLRNIQGLKKRKINFEDIDIGKTNGKNDDSDFISSKWKKSLKRRKQDDTSFKIGESFSLMQFRKSKSNQKVRKKSELDFKTEKPNDAQNTCDISSQSYTLCISNTTDTLDPFLARLPAQQSSSSIKSNLKPKETSIRNANVVEIPTIEQNSKFSLNSDDLSLAVPLSDDENEKSQTPEYLSAKFQPIVKIPRVSFPTNDPAVHENSLIGLEISKSFEETDVKSLSDTSSTLLGPLASQLIKNSENSQNDLGHDIVMTLGKSSQRQNDTVTEVDATKISPPAVPKKKCLGMRIGKRGKPAVSELSRLNSSPGTKNKKILSAALNQTEDIDNKNVTRRSRKSKTSPEVYNDSSIELNVTNSEQELFSKRLKTRNSSQSGVVRNCDMTTSQNQDISLGDNRNCSENAPEPEIDKGVVGNCISDFSQPLDSTALTGCYENNDLELDIFECCGITRPNDQSEVTQNIDDMVPEIFSPLPPDTNEIDENMSRILEHEYDEGVNEAISQSILSNDEVKDKTFRWVLPSTQSDQNTDFFERNSSESNLGDEMNVATSQKSICQETNITCSDDSLLCALEALSPESNAALNRRLDFIDSQNTASQSASKIRISPISDFLATPPKSVKKSEPVETENFPSDSQLENNEYVLSLEDESTIMLPSSMEPCSPSILDQTRYIIDDCNLSASRGSPEIILFEEDSFRLELSQTQHPEPAKQTKLECLLNDDIWDQSSDVDNEIQSFYHDQTCTPSDITVIRDCDRFNDVENELQSFYHDQTCTPSHITIINEDSSPIAKSLTPGSVENNEIFSFYESQSPDAVACSIGADTKCGEPQSSKSDPNIVECSQTKNLRRSSRLRKSVLSSPSLPHSTPSNASTKKTPSPTYTPILKKLMLKKANKTNNKRRISSQRFRSEPFLADIQEEEEKKTEESDKNNTLSLPVEIECDKAKTSKLLNTSRLSSCSGGSYQIDGPTLENALGFKMNLENLQDIKTDKQYQFITLISVEIFAQTRADLKPDPEYDAINCLFYSIHHDAAGFPRLISGIILVDGDNTLTWDINRFKCDKIIVQNEAELFDKFLTVIREWDPDMFIGYEVEMLSWGYLIQRSCFLGMSYSHQLSRLRESPKPNEPNDRPVQEDDEYSNELKLPGRIILNVWRLMRHEVTLQSYTFESILFHVQHQRVPYHSNKFLTECWKDPLQRWIVIDYFLLRAECNITLLEQLDFIGRTSELARLFGIQFYEVLSRGSQFRVESMMLRLAKTQNYVAVSPSVRQRYNMRAPESLPLIMEPESKFYTDPVIVLDFQSLYPSIIIAYNYCFSTCLGRIDDLGKTEPFHFGCVEHKIPPDLLLKLESSLNLSPAGVAFVDETIRKGILPSMLEEILETRLMVKKSMKENKDNSILKRVLHARQLGLKLIANVTYGYTSANFSGRMPCIEIADSVVSKGRETLERAIELVNNTQKWGARVVYGDTDSLFVLVPNRTKEEALRIGAEIADAVTNENPKPVKLKLEKVYLPCMLQTKKRYVGYMYESVDQEKPIYDAKGIETVRRDGCPAISKILEKSLKVLFETRNINTVKQYVQRQFTKLIAGRISIQELTFAREYRGMSNYKPAACVPALQIVKQALLKDRRAEPRIKERVKYVITSGPPGVPLIRLVRTPQEFLDSPGSLINTEYYITRAIIPALERCFILMNVHILPWYTELPKKQKMNLPINYELKDKSFKKTTISHYFSSSKCLSCSKVAGGMVCQGCHHKPQRLALILGNMINEWQRKRNNVEKICRSCCGRSGPIECSSLDCPIYYVFRQSAHEAEQVRFVEDLRWQYLHF